jgi:DNA-binding LacI/PurR family transcriptional regulator
VTLQTVADRVGVSRMTVSNAFSRPDQPSEELRKKILAAADELGYAGPDPSGRALAKGRTGAVGVILTDSLEYAFTDQLATDLMAAISTELAPTGLALTLLTATSGETWIPARDVPLDGALVFSCSNLSQSVDWLRRRRLPMVFVDQEPVDDVTCINIDESGGARAAAQHLIDLGHDRIAIVASTGPNLRSPTEPDPDGKYTNRERMKGWIEALEAAGITPVIVPVEHSIQSAATATVELLSGPAVTRPSGILCYSDTLAVGVMQTARRLGISIPHELSIVGFDDARFAKELDPPLTTVHQDVVAKGTEATAALTDAIAAKAAGETVTPRQIVLATYLVVRESTAPAPVVATART